MKAQWIIEEVRHLHQGGISGVTLSKDQASFIDPLDPSKSLE